jgi:succinyl-CoA synthetase alpha subunit
MARRRWLRSNASYPTLDGVPDAIDLALIAVPAEQCLDVVDACVRKRVHSVVVISSGFAEVDAHGAHLQAELVGRAHRGGMRVVGPNCFGVINTAEDIRMNGTFASRMPAAGGIGFASQSGALGVAVLESSLSAGLGLSSFVSVGNKADVSSNDLLRYWSQDSETRAILLYLESSGNLQAFARVAPVVSRRTPIVVVKAGRSVAGTRAAASHTAALAALALWSTRCSARPASSVSTRLRSCSTVARSWPTSRRCRVAVSPSSATPAAQPFSPPTRAPPLGSRCPSSVPPRSKRCASSWDRTSA